MLRWYPGEIKALNEADSVDFLTLPVSWIVSIRASEPVLPPLRGNEIIVVPSRVLDELWAERTADWLDVVSLADEQGAVAVLVDEPPENGRGPRAPLLIASSTFVSEAELVINREITERRSDLYRLGSALARVQASAPGAGGLNAYLTATEAASGHPLMLVSATGSTMGRSESAPRRLSASVLESALDARGDVEILISGPRLDWLVRLVESRGLQQGAILAIGLKPGAATESARLALRQTAEAITGLYDQGAGAAAGSGIQRSELIRALLLGSGTLDDPLVIRQVSDLQLVSPLRVVIFTNDAGDDFARQVLTGKRDRTGTQIDGDVVVVLNAGDTSGLDQLQAIAGRLVGTTLVVSESVPDVTELPAAYRQARAFSQLARQGAISGSVVDLAEPLQAGVYGLLQEVWNTSQEAGSKLSRLVESALQPLVAYDEERRGGLIPSLEAYLDSGGSLTAAADRLGVHRNTLSYRLNRIEELLDQDLSDARVRFLLQFALAARRLEQATSA